MKNRTVFAGLTAGLFLIAFSAGFAQKPPEKVQPGGAYALAGERGERLAKFLDLTPEQQTKFDGIRKARQEEAKAFREELAKLRPELREAMKDPKADMSKVDGLIDRLAQVRAAHLKSALRSMKEMEKVLTPDQLEKFRRFQSRMGWGRGPGRGFDRGFGFRRGLRPGWGPRPFRGIGWRDPEWF